MVPYERFLERRKQNVGAVLLCHSPLNDDAHDIVGKPFDDLDHRLSSNSYLRHTKDQARNPRSRDRQTRPGSITEPAPRLNRANRGYPGALDSPFRGNDEEPADVLRFISSQPFRTSLSSRPGAYTHRP